ncbi:MAG: carbohydrate-binding family 9-like protein [Fusicatenibacter sp.]|nr:carbohydrate-binding family 9-like protein [Lachnospiraceae bacterium]MDY2936907.1 carbohydrate-binding family 9-like protein [Fusicatenibacter sp.]
MENTYTFTLQYPWDSNGCCPPAAFHLRRDSNGFHMHICVTEKDPRRMETRHLHFVHEDSCVEWFVNFAPGICDRYFNFEINANGAMYAAFRKDRFDYQLLTPDDLASMNISARIHADTWEVSYTVPFSLIRNYIPGYCEEEQKILRANFYKCGDLTPYPHYGMWNVFFVDPPDFHRPEYFGEISF